MGSTARDNRRGMSLVEILVTIFVLVVGLMAVIRVLVPGLQALPRTRAAALARDLAVADARGAEAAAANRPDAILRIRDDLAQTRVPTDGWVVDHTVSLDDTDQVSLAQSTPGSPPALSTAYPKLVFGELFEIPGPLTPYVVEHGPYEWNATLGSASLRVFLPSPWTQVVSGAEDDGAATNARTFSVTGAVATLDSSPELVSIPGFVACYTQVAASGEWQDVVGEDPAYDPLAGTVTLAATGTIVPYSVTLYEVAPGFIVPDANDARAGMVRYNPMNLMTDTEHPVGTKVACLYVMATHLRDSFDDAMVARRPGESELAGNRVPDIMHYDTMVPDRDTTIIVDGVPWTGRIVKLPVDRVDRSTPLDETGPDVVRVVDKMLGQLQPLTGAAPAGDVYGPYVRVPAWQAGFAIRIYYRMSNGYMLERHVAASDYSVVRWNTTTGAWEFSPSESRGLKQNWFRADVAGGVTTLTFRGSAVGTPLDFWTGGPMVSATADGHRISVDYRVADPGQPGGEVLVTGETHLVDFSTHAFTLRQTNVTRIEAIRGVSYTSRVCFDNEDRTRNRRDSDTIVMR